MRRKQEVLLLLCPGTKIFKSNDVQVRNQSGQAKKKQHKKPDISVGIMATNLGFIFLYLKNMFPSCVQ